MTFRFLVSVILAGLTLCASPDGRAVECVVSREVYAGNSQMPVREVSVAEDAEAKALCGSLRAVNRRRDDPNPDVVVSASYVEFEVPRNAAERAYNEWIRKLIGQVPFEGPLEGRAGGGSTLVREYIFGGDVRRSRQLLSATYGAWICCGAHGYGQTWRLNIDAETGHPAALGDFVHLGAVGNYCWQQFSKMGDQNRGKRFAEIYSRRNPFTDEDFGTDPKTLPHEQSPLQVFAGEAVYAWAAGLPSDKRAIEAFARALRGTQHWSFTDKVLWIDFGELLGYGDANFVCEIANDALRPMARAGVALPP